MIQGYKTLYKKSSKGTILFRTVTVESGSNVGDDACQSTTTGSWVEGFGPTNPKVQEKIIKPTKSKTAFNRAVSLCDADHAKRIKLGYFESVEDAMNLEPTPKAMLVKDMHADDIEKMGDDEFPIYESIKLNGIRGTYHHDKEQILSRELNAFDLPEMTQQCTEICTALKLKYLDFEIDAEGFPINEIVSMVRHNRSKLKAYIFDVPSEKVYTDRLVDCQRVLDYCQGAEIYQGTLDRIRVLSVNVAEDKYQVRAFYDKAVADKHEGIILRKPSGLYCWNNKTTRSDVIRKVKPILSHEFKIVGIEWDERKVSGNHVCLVEFICETTEGEQFKVAPTSWGIEKRNNWCPEGISKNRMDAPGVADLLAPLSIDFREYTKTGKPFHILSCYLRDEEI